MNENEGGNPKEREVGGRRPSLWEAGRTRLRRLELRGLLFYWNNRLEQMTERAMSLKRVVLESANISTMRPEKVDIIIAELTRLTGENNNLVVFQYSSQDRIIGEMSAEVKKIIYRDVYQSDQPIYQVSKALKELHELYRVIPTTEQKIQELETKLAGLTQGD